MATIEHDAERWGWARAADAERSRLVRVGDLVDTLARVRECAPVAAAAVVLERLSGVALFELRKDGDARCVDDAYRFPKDGGARWIEGADGFDGFGASDPAGAFHGVGGAWEFVRCAWCLGGAKLQGFAAADRLAVLEAVAVTALPELDWVAQSMPEAAAPVPPALPAALTARRPGDVWSSQQRGALLAYVDQRRQADPRLKSETLHDELGVSFSCSASNIKQQLAAARKERSGLGVKRAA